MLVESCPRQGPRKDYIFSPRSLWQIEEIREGGGEGEEGEGGGGRGEGEEAES